MTNPSPWAPDGQNSAVAGPDTRSGFRGLDTTLTVLAIIAGISLVISVVVAFADSDPVAFMAAGSSLMIMILCGLGRVVIHMAQTLDRIAVDAREVRGISEWQMRHEGNAGGLASP